MRKRDFRRRVKSVLDDVEIPARPEDPEDIPATIQVRIEGEDLEIPQWPTAGNDVYEWCKLQWMRDAMSTEDMAVLTGVNRNRISGWISGSSRKDGKGWRHEREERLKQAVSIHLADESKRVQRLLDNMFGILERSVAKLVDERTELGVAAMQKFTTSVESLFKIRQLMVGNPTDIYADAGVQTWADVVKKLRAVDILDYKVMEQSLPEPVKEDATIK